MASPRRCSPAAPRLKIVSNVAVGYNNFDVAAATRRGVMLTNTPGAMDDTTADFAWCLILATARRLPEADRLVRSGKWTRWRFMEFLGHDIYGKTIGICGFGRIGRGVARRAMGFGMKVLYTSRSRAPDSVEQEFRASVRRQAHAAARIGCRHAAPSAVCGDAALHRRRRAGAHEEDGDSRQRRPRAGGR